MSTTQIGVNVRGHRYNTREPDSDDQWDRGCTAMSYTITGLNVGGSDLVVDFELEYDRDYYLLYADYDTGDSFGNDDNQLEFIDLYQSRKGADEANYMIEKNPGDPNKTYQRSNGQVATFYAPWEGHFEHLNHLEILVLRREQ